MILEENIGGVVCTIIRESGETAQLAVGDYFSDHERSTLTVTGGGKIVVRVDPNCTVEIRGVEPEVAVVEAVAVAAEPPVIVYPVKAEKTAE